MYPDGGGIVEIMRVAGMVREAIEKEFKSRYTVVILERYYIIGIVRTLRCGLHVGGFRGGSELWVKAS